MVKIPPTAHDVVTTTIRRAWNNTSNSFCDSLLRK